MTKEPIPHELIIKEIPTAIVLKEDSTIKMTVKGLWWIISSVVLAAVIITTANYNLNYKIEKLSIETTKQHETVLIKLNQIDMNQKLFVLKQSFEEIMILSVKYHDDHYSVTNRMTLDEEIEYRRKIREILNR
jgi:hypothetical protein